MLDDAVHRLDLPGSYVPVASSRLGDRPEKGHDARPVELAKDEMREAPLQGGTDADESTLVGCI